MDKWSAAFTAIGGLAAVGGLIDLALYNSEKEKLQARLDDWWLRFTDVKWSNFGRAEAELAVQILDRWAGPRLWSWKRWRFSAIVTLAVLLLVVAWNLVRASLNNLGIHLPIERDRAFVVLKLVTVLVAFALSLSLTRYIATSVARLCRGAIFNSVAFALLLALHLLLLLFWTELVLKLEIAAAALLWYLQDPINAWEVMPDYWMLLFSRRVGPIEYISELSEPGIFDGIVAMPDWSGLISLKISDQTDLDLTSEFALAMSIVANGPRILFALVFLSSFVFRPLVQVPVSRLWYGAMNSGKPIFTMLFGAVGTMIAVAQILTQ